MVAWGSFTDALQDNLQVKEFSLVAGDGNSRHVLEKIRVGVSHKDFRICRLKHNDLDIAIGIRAFGPTCLGQPASASLGYLTGG